MRENDRNYREINEAYSQFIQSYDWDFFITATFRKERSDGIRAHEHVWNRLNQLDVNRGFLATESGRRTGRIHVHGLVRQAGHSYPTYRQYFLWKALFDKFGRSDVQRITSKSDVAAYCSKYVTKGLEDYDFYGKW